VESLGRLVPWWHEVLGSYSARFGILGLIAAVLLLGFSGRAAADGIVVTPGDNRRAEGRVWWTAPNAPGGGQARPDAPTESNTPQVDQPDCTIPGSTLLIACGGGGGSSAPSGPVAGAPTPAMLALRAADSLELPLPLVAIRPNLKFSDGNNGGISGVPVWVWHDSASWRPLAPVRLAAGPVWAEILAAPQKQTWDFGDGGIVSCRGPGVAFVPGRRLNDQSPRCGHKYLKSSTNFPRGAYVVHVTVQWAVTWMGSGGAQGALAPFFVETSFPYVVREARAELVSP